MRSLKILCLIAATILAQSVMAEGLPGSTPSPFGELQTQLDALATRTQALEDSAPNSSVEGRTYCFVLNLQVMIGRANNETEELQSNVIRRTATFSGGMFDASHLSNTLNKQLDDGTVAHDDVDPIGLLIGTFTQTGSKVDITFDTGLSANWYVSKDGSTIHGSSITHSALGPPGQPPVVTIGFVRNWTLVETDPLDVCDAENQ
jgi:hypothetical protein